MSTPLLRHPQTRTHSLTAAKVHVTVTDLSGVQRVLTLLTGRQYEPTRFSAEEFGGGRWRTSFDLTATADQCDLLAERLHRMPSVLLVDVRPGNLTASSA